MKCRTLTLILVPLAAFLIPGRGFSGEEKKAVASPEAMQAPIVELIDSGSDPKSPIRMKVEKGLKQNLVMLIDMDMSMEMGNNKFPTPKMPTQKMTMEIEVTDVNSEGDITYGFNLKSIDLVEDEKEPSPIAGMLKGMLKTMEGLSGQSVVTNRMITKTVDLKIPETVPAQARQMMGSMKQSMQQFLTPMPDEPVGTGAKWKVIQDMEVNGIKVKQTIIQELVEFKGQSLKTKVNIQQEADPQDVAPPGMPAGMKVRLTSLDSKGSGDIELDTGWMVPRKSKIEMSSDTKMEVQAQTMRTMVKMTTTASGSPPGGK